MKSLAQIEAAELLPMIKNIYKKYSVPPVEIENGFKGITKLLTKGTDERVIMFTDFTEILNEFSEGEANNFELDDEGWDYPLTKMSDEDD